MILELVERSELVFVDFEDLTNDRLRPASDYPGESSERVHAIGGHGHGRSHEPRSRQQAVVPFSAQQGSIYEHQRRRHNFPLRLEPEPGDQSIIYSLAVDKKNLFQEPYFESRAKLVPIHVLLPLILVLCVRSS